MVQISFRLIRQLLIVLIAAHLSGCEKWHPTERDKALAEQWHAEIEKRKQKPLPRCGDAKAGGPEDVIRMLYKQYPPLGAKAIKNEPEQVIGTFFDKNLTALMIKNQECERKEGGLCNISVDLLYDAQDAEITDFQVCAMNAGKGTAKVQFRNMGNPEIITYRLSETEAGWRISDILYSGGLGKWTLVRLLSSN